MMLLVSCAMRLFVGKVKSADAAARWRSAYDSETNRQVEINRHAVQHDRDCMLL